MATSQDGLVKVEGEPTIIMPDNSAAGLMRLAIESGRSMAELKDLAELMRQERADRAAEAFAVAVTTFQGICPMVKKERSTTGGKFQFKYASLDDVMDVARPHLAACGLVVTFTSKPSTTGDGYEITCNVRHGTHVESTTITLPCPKLSNMDTVQQFGSVVAYGKRYAICAALNIVISDEDDDANSAGETLNEKELADVKGLMEEKKVEPSAFLTWVRTFQAGADAVEKIAAVNYDKVMDALRRKITPKPTTKK